MANMGMAIDLKRCAGCYACVVACQMHNTAKPGVAWGKVEAREWGEDPDNRRCYVPHACMHCEDAPCVNVCPTGASYVREDGIVMVDYEQCIDCGSCLHACPYDARVRSESSGYYFDAEEPAPYEAEGEQRTNVVEKCIFCAPRIDAGLKPACVVNCPGKARVFGDLDDPESDISVFLANHDDAVQVRNTRFYYVPGADMPQDLLPQSNVEAVVNKGVDSRPADPGVPLPFAVGGVAVAAAAGAGIGMGVKNARQAKAAATGTHPAQAVAVSMPENRPAHDNDQQKGGESHE